MNVSRYRRPHFIKKEECDPAIKLTIIGAEEISYSRSGTDVEYKIVVDLENETGDKFRLSLNDSNLETIARLFGDETDNWLSQEIGLKHDPSIKFKDEVRGGIRVIPTEEVPKKPVTKLFRRTPNPVPAGIQVDEDREEENPF